MSFVLDRTVYLSLCDHTGRLSPYSVGSIVQDNITEMLTAEGVPSSYLLDKFGAAWVVLQTDSLYLRFPGLDERLRVESFAVEKTAARLLADTVLRDENGEVCTCTRVTLCALDISKARPIRLKTALGEKLPAEPVVVDPVIELPTELLKEETIGTYTVRSTDLDFLKHANNVELIRIASSAFSSEESGVGAFKGLRAVYKAQAREGDGLSIRKLYYPGAEKVVLSRDGEIYDEFTFFLNS